MALDRKRQKKLRKKENGTNKQIRPPGQKDSRKWKNKRSSRKQEDAQGSVKPANYQKAIRLTARPKDDQHVRSIVRSYGDTLGILSGSYGLPMLDLKSSYGRCKVDVCSKKHVSGMMRGSCGDHLGIHHRRPSIQQHIFYVLTLL